MSIRITCINKDGGYHENPHVSISELGWQNEQTGEMGRSNRIQMYDWVRDGGVAVVVDGFGNRAPLEAHTTARGTKYVKTRPDRTLTDNLLSLQECRV
jgi:hypothetical protein